MDKTCNKCGMKGLSWDKESHDKTGRWKLMDHKNKDGDWCSKNNNKKQNHQEDHMLCDLCEETSFGLCRTEERYKIHKKVYHPNNEVLTELDWKMKMNHNSKPHDNWSFDPHYHKYKNLG